MARVVRFHQTGGPEVLKIEEVDVAPPGQGDVRIKVQAVGLNRAECMFRAGQYLEAPQFPSSLGYECSGVVESVGAGVTDFKAGDRVSSIPAFSMAQYGSYGEVANMPAHAVTTYPANLSAGQGAAIWMQYITAWCGLVELGRLKEGQAVLVTAASSSVGLAALQIAKACGAMAIAATRKPDKKAKLLIAGADHVVVTEQEDLAVRVMAVTGGKGANIIFDPVSGPYVDTLAQAAAHDAKMFIYGLLDARPTPFPLYASFQKGLWVRAFALFEFTMQAASLSRAKEFVLSGLASGVLKPIIDPAAFTLDRIADAHRYMESNNQFGKIVVRV
ncbi:MAG: NADPH:quinone reductase [Betaproteobacteria bacterium]|nr:NADPH:quinone reductase [Betaproteobacteria bacterium]